MGCFCCFLIVCIFLLSPTSSQVTEFVSLDCGGRSNYTDPVTGLEWVSDSGFMSHGESVLIANQTGILGQHQSRRDFPADNRKYCYTLGTTERRRYLVRATFLYGGSENEDAYPKFELYLDATKWSTVTVSDASRAHVKEMIIIAHSSSIDVCVCCATTGFPFISTLELRPLNLSMYATDFEDSFFLKVAARVNFGAQSSEAIRYPDDPYDRIWVSDLERRQNFLVGVAPGTVRINTSKNIDVMTREYPPVKVMQTAVLGTEGTLSYRLNLEDFPANARALAYFAEIQDLGPNETRKFKLQLPYVPDYSNAVVNIQENANGSYRLYEPSYMNVTLDFVLSFQFTKTRDSTQGPILNAIEISKYLQIAPKTDSQDVTALYSFRFLSAGSSWTDEQGDPCIPTQWDWVTCTSTSIPRVVKIVLSGKNLSGEIPAEINNMKELTELWLDDNFLTGPLPDISNLVNLKIVHLENNRLTGSLPKYLGNLPSLEALYIQNNSFSGAVPQALFSRNITINFEHNHRLHKEGKKKTRNKLIFGVSVGILSVFLILFLGSLVFLRRLRKKTPQKKVDDQGTKAPETYSVGRHLNEEGSSYYIKFSEIEEATKNFSKKIGKGSFGSVYYGQMKNGKEVAVKMMADTFSHLTQQFVTEVSLLSRIHHRNLVPLIGFCEEGSQRILVYEYMHNGTLRDHIQGSAKQNQLDWLARLQIAEDAAKGLEYLHSGCNPSIIHRDVKTSNILLDINMRAKVSDFGLSRQTEEDLTHVSSMARGTVGYLDPEYYATQQLTEKSDVYSFGVVLLELISGKKPESSEDFGSERNIVHWARTLIQKGDVASMVAPTLINNAKIESIWRVAEVALQCVEHRSAARPRMHEIIMAVQEATKIEKGIDSSQRLITSGGSSRAQSSRKTLLTSFLEIESPDLSNSCLAPAAR